MTEKRPTQAEAFVYMFEGTPYINLTNRCCNDCAFCIRNSANGIGEDSLWLLREPSADEVIAMLSGVLDAQNPFPKEIVFCGFGEPTYRLQELIAVAEFAHKRGLKTRLNTNGLGNLIHGRDITDELTGAIDTVSVSLNAPDSARYNALCRPEFGQQSFAALLEFVKVCARKGIQTVLSVVDTLPAKELTICKQLAADIGAGLRVRKLI